MAPNMPSGRLSPYSRTRRPYNSRPCDRSEKQERGTPDAEPKARDETSDEKDPDRLIGEEERALAEYPIDPNTKATGLYKLRQEYGADS
jgi:hypothetical protein